MIVYGPGSMTDAGGDGDDVEGGDGPWTMTNAGSDGDKLTSDHESNLAPVKKAVVKGVNASYDFCIYIYIRFVSVVVVWIILLLPHHA